MLDWKKSWAKSKSWKQHEQFVFHELPECIVVPLRQRQHLLEALCFQLVCPVVVNLIFQDYVEGMSSNEAQKGSMYKRLSPKAVLTCGSLLHVVPSPPSPAPVLSWGNDQLWFAADLELQLQLHHSSCIIIVKLSFKWNYSQTSEKKTNM